MSPTWKIIFIIGIIILITLSAIILHKYIRTSVTGGTEVAQPIIGINHHIGHGIHDYAKNLTEEHNLGTHPLDQNDYTPLQTSGGALTKSAKHKILPKKRWDSYKSWKEMLTDEGAKNEYFRLRSAVLSYPNLDWSKVMEEMKPKLFESREYIGVASLEADGKTLRVVASEPSPTGIGETKSETTIAGVPSNLVAKYADMPGIILFHTHPADIRCSPLPSSHDLSAAIYFGATSRFAACAVISRYGVLAHGLDWSAYKSINSARDWSLPH